MKSVFLVIAIASVAIIGIADAIAMMKWGPDYTLSHFIYTAAKNDPIIPFLAGLLAGHFFFPIVSTVDDKKD